MYCETVKEICKNSKQLRHVYHFDVNHLKDFTFLHDIRN